MQAVGSLRFAVVLACSVSAAHAADKYHVTEQERAACTDDAARLCSSAFPDEDKLLVCMKTNRDALSANCLVAFDAGVKRRRL